MAKSRRGLSMTIEQAQAHAAKHGYALQPYQKAILGAEGPIDLVVAGSPKRQVTLPKPVKMTRPERRYAEILEAMKRRGDILDYKFEGISLSWGTDPATGRQMWYTPDFVVWPTGGTLTLVEVKGKTLFYTALVRFKGARAEWGMHFKFEMHQYVLGEWRRVE